MATMQERTPPQDGYEVIATEVIWIGRGQWFAGSPQVQTGTDDNLCRGLRSDEGALRSTMASAEVPSSVRR